jgi:hypothetical protein
MSVDPAQPDNPDVYFFTANCFKHNDPARFVKKIAKKEKCVRVSDNCVCNLMHMENTFEKKKPPMTMTRR